ncbi:TPA: hypothetical protein N0F65_012263 [Lagenidium giganteum]|uniref:PX domain-containing protein n=1 Tax=Lagenidium giganteum TaxID=4803 RepID=A0AAV2ZFZ2_9STRA|nr:TPA: hypothetical protein N0F65_012263 [Lagenidium giganteum]
MDPGIVTSELAKPNPALSPSGSPKKADTIISPAFVTCRKCRVQTTLDDMDKHECKKSDLAKAGNSPSKAATVDAAARRASSFLDSFLDAPKKDPQQQQQQQALEDAYEKARAELPQQQQAPPPKQQRYGTYAFEDVVIRDAEAVDTWSDVHVDHRAPMPHRYESLPQMTPVKTSPTRIVPPAPLVRSRANSSTTTSPVAADSALTVAPPVQRSFSSPEAAPVQCRVRGVRVTKDNVALYSIISSLVKSELAASDPSNNNDEIIVERRYREFYAFALNVYSMFPSQELWQRLPPKAFCNRANALSDGFLLRRKNGLDDFIRHAIELMDLGSSAQGSIGQWYLVRKFLNLPPTLAIQPTKDRSLVAAMNELKKHARQTTGWALYQQTAEHDAVHEKQCDGFQMVKRVHTCSFPARAVFDMITKAFAGVSASPEMNDPEGASAALLSTKNTTKKATWFPLIENDEIYRRENGNTWTERTIYKGKWHTRNMEMISIKSWKVEENGTIIIVIIPADDAEWRDTTREGCGEYNRVDCVLGGWVITPTPQDETCSVTWIMQANFGECDPQNEFTGSQGITSLIARQFLLSWAEELTFLLQALKQQYDPTYYRNLGPLSSSFQNVKVERRDTIGARAGDDPRVYILAQEIEPCMCLLIHKSTNKNVLIFRTNHKSKLDLDVAAPLKAEWIMFEKPGNPRTDLSPIERNTTYNYVTKNIGPNVHHFTLDLIRRDCVLRYDALYGYGLFTTINGKPNVLLKRIYLNYGKSRPLIGFSKIEEVTLVGDSDMEVLTLNPVK